MGDRLPVVRTAGKVASVSAGGLGAGFTCVVLTKGSAKCWGKGSSGRLGQGNTIDYGDDPGEMGVNLPAIALF